MGRRASGRRIATSARRAEGVGGRTRQRLDALLSELSRAFANVMPAAVDEEIERWLCRLAAVLQADHARVTQMSADGRALHATHTYGCSGTPALPTIVLDTELPWLMDGVRRGRLLCLERVPEGVPADAAGEAAYLASTGIKSLVVLPFQVGGVTLGAVCFGANRRRRRWPGPVVRGVQVAAEVIGTALARKQDRAALEERLAFERLIGDLVRDFVNVPFDELSARIQEGLARLLGHLGVERSTLFRASKDGLALTPVESVGRDGSPPPQGEVRLPWYLGELRQGRTLSYGRLPEGLPPEASAEREFVRRVGMRSHLAIPLVADDRFWGAITFGAFGEGRAWTEEEAKRLRLVGEIMMDAVRRCEGEEATRRQRDELAHMARVAALGELTAALAHELNQPLAAIRTNAQTTRRLLAAGRPPSNFDEILGDIETAAGRAGDLIQRLRDLLRRRDLEKVPVSLSQVVQDIASIARTETIRHGARLALRLAAGLPLVEGDAVQLQQVVLNLVRNAAEAMIPIPEAQREVVVCTAHADAEHVIVSVEDAGPPIDADALASMFNPFHTTKPDGLGMGLAISRSIIETHAGRLWAERRPEGGLAVQFTLPIAPFGVAGPMPPADPPPGTLAA